MLNVPDAEGVDTHPVHVVIAGIPIEIGALNDIKDSSRFYIVGPQRIGDADESSFVVGGVIMIMRAVTFITNTNI